MLSQKNVITQLFLLFLLMACAHADDPSLFDSENSPAAADTGQNEGTGTSVAKTAAAQAQPAVEPKTARTVPKKCMPWENCDPLKLADAGPAISAGTPDSAPPLPARAAPLANRNEFTGNGAPITEDPSLTGGRAISSRDKQGTEYLIGPGDQIQIFVWRNQDVSVQVPVRPDGKISTPLVEDMLAVGKTPTQLARDIEKVLQTYIRDPVVTVIVTGFGGPYSQQIRVIGQATQPKTLPYRENMSLLDVIIAVGGLTEYAAGNKATIVRNLDGKQKQIKVRIDDLVKKGDIKANVFMRPGDILIIPESWF